MSTITWCLCMYIDIEWPEEDEALSDSARSTIEALLSSDPQSRPDALGLTHCRLSRLDICTLAQCYI